MAGTIHCSGKPMMCCQMSIDMPKAVPRDIATVPTMTSAAATARVSTSMMRKIKHTEAITAIIRS
ncbi:Uncharacterised protein [Mycobacteroides abscessus subsp. abscessus]|nr:Uncharacterised protein [Mycobacteroides abscessus subsp. abscessus]